MEQDETRTIEHYSQSNPAGVGHGDVPALLRRVAQTMEKKGPIDVQDLVMHSEITENGEWFSLTVYFHRRTELKLVSGTSSEPIPYGTAGTTRISQSWSLIRRSDVISEPLSKPWASVISASRVSMFTSAAGRPSNITVPPTTPRR